MSNQPWDMWVEQLQDPDPKVRRKASQRLAAVGDPAVIPFLRTAYLQEDDESARDAMYDALATYKGMQQGLKGFGLPVSEPLLNRLLVGLAGLFVVLLVLNVALRVVQSLGDDDPAAEDSGRPTDRDTLVTRMEERIALAQQDVTSLQTVIADHFNTGNFACDTVFMRPKPLELSEADKRYYPDLKLVGEKIDLVIANLLGFIVQPTWDRGCQNKNAEGFLDAQARLNEAAIYLEQASTALAEAKLHPAPTYGPSPTLTPTITLTPSITPTLEPGTATQMATMAAATAVPNTAVPTITPTPKPSATPAPPLPNLDYEQIARDMEAKFTIISSLTNRLGAGTGIVNLWERAQAGEAIPTSFCALDAWPQPFTLTAEQEAEKNREGVADPLLDEAIAALNEGLSLASEARAIFEPSCLNQTLANTASQGLPIAQEALQSLRAAQSLVEQLDNRKK